MRPGCDRPAAARLTYDTVAGSVWLDEPITSRDPAQQVCGEHAATLTVPVGWTVTDRRSVPPTTAPEPVHTGERQVSARHGQDVSRQPAAEPDDAQNPRAEKPRAEKPRTGKKNATKRKQRQPRGTLVERALEWSGPQESILTQGRPDPPRAHAEE